MPQYIGIMYSTTISLLTYKGSNLGWDVSYSWTPCGPFSAWVKSRRLSTSWSHSRKAGINAFSADVTAKIDFICKPASFPEDVVGGLSSFGTWLSVGFASRIRLPICFSKGVASDGAQRS